MNDHDLAAALWTIHRERALLPDAPAVRDQLLRIPLRGTPQRRLWWPSIGTGSLRAGLSAARFVLAGVIVALFGGFLLTGALMQQRDPESMPGAVASAAATPTPTPQPSSGPTEPPEAPVATTDLLPGVTLVTEEVEPGVLRIVNDGVRDLSRQGDGFNSNLAFSPDGGVWVFGPDVSFRLGDDASYPTGDDSPAWLDVPVEVGPDGTRWWLQKDRELVRSDGESVHLQQAPDRRHRFAMWFDLGPDGAIWAVYASDKSGGGGVLVRLDGEDWTKISKWPGGRFEISPKLPANVDFDEGWQAATVALLRETGESSLGWWLWGPGGHIWDAPATEEVDGIPLWDMDAAGGFWAYMRDQRPSDAGPFEGDMLSRFDGTHTHLYTKEDGIPLASGGMYDWRSGFLRAAPDGSVWLASNVTDSEARNWGCNGVARFDGTSRTRYLTDHCIFALRIGPDGSAWVQAGGDTDEGAVELYRIRP